MATDLTLQTCLAYADAMEGALDALGDTSSWPAYPALRQRCETFRRDCREIVDQRGLAELAIAFIGPKNAGKTTLLSMLLRNHALIDQLNAGDAADAATQKIIWISSYALQNIDPRFEEAWHVGPGELVHLGRPYSLVDVPGSNEANPERAEAAERALRAAHLKVLVVEARTIEDAAVTDYVEHADGACFLPVINHVRPGLEESDVDGFLTRLQKAVPNATLLRPLRIPDFHLESPEKARSLEKAATRELREAVSQAIRSQHVADVLESQLRRRKERFRDHMQADLRKALPATSAAIAEIQEAEGTLGLKALERLLGADDDNRAVLAGLRQQLRSLYHQQTPVLFFPWRTFVGIANLLHGALEKIPLLLVGSLPSLAASAMTAVKNVAKNREFSESQQSGLQKHAELIVKESLSEPVNRLEMAVRSDLRSTERVTSSEALEVEFEGLDLLQSRSSRLFHEVLGRHAVSRPSVWLTGLLGLLVFWSIFVWPLVALYTDYFGAVSHVLQGENGADPTSATEGAGQHLHFPAHSLPMLATSFLLAIFPMLFWLLLVLSWVGQMRRSRRCLEGLKEGHHRIIRDLNEHKLLKVKAEHPRLQACLRLFSGDDRM